MFEHWNAHIEPFPYRVVDPPHPVTVDLGTAFARTPRSRNEGLPMRVRAEGLIMTGTVPGQVHAWARTTDGDWLAYCWLTTTSGNKHGRLDIQQWVPAAAVTPLAEPTQSDSD